LVANLSLLEEKTDFEEWKTTNGKRPGRNLNISKWEKGKRVCTQSVGKEERMSQVHRQDGEKGEPAVRKGVVGKERGAGRKFQREERGMLKIGGRGRNRD